MDSELTLVGHLAELRKRLFICIGSFLIASSAVFPQSKQILRFLKLPAADTIKKLAFFSPQEAFMAHLRISLICGFIISLPVILYELWAFISPAIGERSRRHALDFIIPVFLMFIAGCAFAYFFLLPAGLKFLLSFGGEDLEPVISVGKYIAFVSGIILASGLVFQMPVLSFILSKAGVIDSKLLRSKFKYALLIIFIIAAIITPTTDIFNMLLLAVPMLILYEVSIWVAWLAKAKIKASSGFALFAFFFIVFCPGQPSFGQDISNQDCLECHNDINLEAFNSSAHAANLCTSCHNDIQELPHANKPAKVNCAGCHNIESDVYNTSDHGKASKAGSPAANCLDCHGAPHAILDSRNPESPVFRRNIPQTCAKCHEDQEKMAKYNLLEQEPVMTYSQTVHGKALIEKGFTQSAVCTDCHGSHNLSAPNNPQSKIYRQNVPNTCGKCHENVLNTYLRSVHGKSVLAGGMDAPVCTDCHGEHAIKSHKDPLSSVYSAVIAEKTCGQCHASERIISKYHLPGARLETYFQSYHGLASKMGVTTVANCVSCHGVHDILPSDDPESAVHKNNLAHTCGKCHPNAGAELAKGSVHLTPSLQKDRAVFYVSRLYLILIILTIGGMVCHNILDFIPKFVAYRRRYHEKAKELRFTINERIQHAVLVVSFLILAYTGFALRWPNSWWAVPFTFWDPGFDWRGSIHRIMALIFSALVVYHSCYLFFTKRGKEQFKALMPKWKDVLDVIKMIRYNLGIDKNKPARATYNYIEKAEYWALVWGAVIMIATGCVLTYENFFLQHFPKWVLDVARAIHYYEAVLAILAILVWHIYFVIIDPEHYPLNFAMFTGKASKEHHGEG